VRSTTVRDARLLLERPDIAAEWAATNFVLARRHFSYAVLERQLDALLHECFGEGV
jgi:hypothetical protein